MATMITIGTPGVDITASDITSNVTVAGSSVMILGNVPANFFQTNSGTIASALLDIAALFFHPDSTIDVNGFGHGTTGADLSNMTILVLPKNLTSLSVNAFQKANLSGLTCLSFPDALGSIGSQAFAGANLSNVTSINFPDSLTSVDSTAFQSATLTNLGCVRCPFPGGTQTCSIVSTAINNATGPTFASLTNCSNQTGFCLDGSCVTKPTIANVTSTLCPSGTGTVTADVTIPDDNGPVELYMTGFYLALNVSPWTAYFSTQPDVPAMLASFDDATTLDNTQTLTLHTGTASQTFSGGDQFDLEFFLTLVPTGP